MSISGPSNDRHVDVAATASGRPVSSGGNAMEILQSGNHAASARKVPAQKTAQQDAVRPCEIMGVGKSPRAAQTTGGTTQEVESPMPNKRTAAREALDAHDALRASAEREPELMADGMPFDPELWQAWYDSDHKPAYARWHAAMDALDVALGQKIGRHPFTFRPICEAIIRG